jgi:hypothetical protein
MSVILVPGATPSAPSALIMSVPPPSIRQPPSLLVAVLVLLLLARMSVPRPSLVIVAEPAMAEAIVAVTPGSVVMLAGVVPRVSVEPVIV